MLRAIAAGVLTTLAFTAHAGLVTDAPPDADKRFYEQLQSALSHMAQSKDPLLRRLYEAAKASPGAIHIRPMTDDKATWNSDGSRERGHTDPDDKRPKFEGRSKPADATVYLPPDAVDPAGGHWKSGTLAHELTHAVDLANGRYSKDVTVRERRATFMQNVWRAQLGSPLRTGYHGRFPTLDYQEAIKSKSTDEYARYLFTRSDFPAPPAASASPEKPGKTDKTDKTDKED